MEKRTEFLSYALPYWDNKEIDAVVEAIRSNWWSRGPKVSEFEEKFAKYVGAKYAVALNSCTAAFTLALEVCGVGEGDEVIVPSMTFCSTANTVVHTGATPVLCDVLAENGLIDPDKIEALITEKTKAIMPVHYAGRACDMDKINAIAKKHGLYVIEDCAHAIGTKYKGNVIGSNGNLCCYSFYTTKNIATGEGGMLVGGDEELIDRARVLSVHGMSKNAWNRYAKGGSWKYEVCAPGYKFNLTDIAASLGLVQLERLDWMNGKRAEYAAIYEEILEGLDSIKTLKEAEGSEGCWHLYIINVQNDKLSIDRDRFIDILNNEYNIGTSVHFIPVHTHPFYRETYGYTDEMLPEASKLFEGIISLPLYPGMKEEDVRYVAQAVREIAEKYAK